MKNFKRILKTFIWMTLLLVSQTTYAATMESYDYNFDNYTAQNPRFPYKIKLSGVKPSDKASIIVYWDILKERKKCTITTFNEGGALVNGWNTCWMENMPTGVEYRTEIEINDTVATVLDLPTPGPKTLIAGLTVDPRATSVDLSFLYNRSDMFTELEVTFSKTPDFSYPTTKKLVGLKYVKISHCVIDYSELGNMVMKGQKIYCKVSAVNNENKDSLALFSEFLIPGNTDAVSQIKKTPFSIFPNPIKENEYCVLKIDSPTEVLIFDLTGNIIFRKNAVVGENHLDLTQLPSGVYLAKTTGNNSFTQRIIKL